MQDEWRASACGKDHYLGPGITLRHDKLDPGHRKCSSPLEARRGAKGSDGLSLAECSIARGLGVYKAVEDVGWMEPRSLSPKQANQRAGAGLVRACLII